MPAFVGMESVVIAIFIVHFREEFFVFCCDAAIIFLLVQGQNAKYTARAGLIAMHSHKK